MLDLKRNSKYQLIEATGKRTRKSSIYTPKQTEDFKISRSKFADFLICPRCFYLDRVVGLDAPGTPGWALNEATDILYKKEFDICRKNQTPHRLFEQYGLNHFVPFQHPEIDKWRDSMHHGLSARFGNTNIMLFGGVDDVWINKETNKLIVVDYKSQSSEREITTNNYLNGIFKQGYKMQMDFYVYLLREMGFDVHPDAYFVVCNGDRTAADFNGLMKFDEYLIPYEWNTEWIHNEVINMIDCMNSDSLPESNKSCKNCAYAAQRAIKEL